MDKLSQKDRQGPAGHRVDGLVLEKMREMAEDREADQVPDRVEMKTRTILEPRLRGQIYLQLRNQVWEENHQAVVERKIREEAESQA